MGKHKGWILGTLGLVLLFGAAAFWLSPIKTSFTPPLSSAGLVEVGSFLGSHYYELNMENEFPMTTACGPVTEVESEKFRGYRCIESDDRYLSDWSCGKPTDDETPSKEFVEIIQGDLVTCNKKLEDFRDRFQ